VFTRDPKYLDIIRRWSGRDIPVVLQAVAALEAGDTAQAAKLVAQLPPPDSSRLVTPPESIEDPLTHANVLSAIGQRRDALAVLESLDPRRFGVLEVDPRWAMYPKSLLARGLLYEDLGDRARAIASYERYLELMRDADAALQPQLQLARARVRSLRDSPAVPLTR
jgi:tetratricopeptide (TPR) repeat protein